MAAFVNFFCQKCLSPLKVDSSLLDLNVAEFEEIIRPLGISINANNANSIDKVNGSKKKGSFAVPPLKKPSQINITAIDNQTTDESAAFTPLSSSYERSSERQKATLNHRLKVAARLFDLSSAHSKIDHPLCSDCAAQIIQNLKEQAEFAANEQKLCEAVIAEISTEAKQQEDMREKDEEELRKLKQENEKLMAALAELEKEDQELEAEIRQLRQNQHLVQEEENNQLREQNIQLKRQSDNLLLQQSLENQCKSLIADIKRLQSINVYNEAFKIWYDGPFGTINGYRLGHNSNVHVPWDEINHGWGQCVLLLYLLANKFDFTFSMFKLLPMGNCSRIERFEGERVSYELFNSSDPVGKLFGNRKYDAGMTAFLYCLNQFGEHIEKLDKHFKMPYRIYKDKIGDLSIRLHSSNEETWTKALKYMLADLKWLLAFCSKPSEMKE